MNVKVSEEECDEDELNETNLYVSIELTLCDGMVRNVEVDDLR